MNQYDTQKYKRALKDKHKKKFSKLQTESTMIILKRVFVPFEPSFQSLQLWPSYPFSPSSFFFQRDKTLGVPNFFLKKKLPFSFQSFEL